MKTLLLAAGRGSRLGEKTSHKPKCLVELAGKPLLEWQLKALRDCGISSIAIVRGYQREQITGDGLEFFENDRWDITNMVSSLLCASSWLLESPTIVSYTDIVYPASFISELSKSSDDIVVGYLKDWLPLWSKRFANPLEDAEGFKIAASGTLVSIGKRKPAIHEVEGQYAGLFFLSPKGFSKIRNFLSALPLETVDKLDMTTLFQKLIEQGVEIKTRCLEGPWLEVDSESDLKLYEELNPIPFTKIPHFI